VSKCPQSSKTAGCRSVDFWHWKSLLSPSFDSELSTGTWCKAFNVDISTETALGKVLEKVPITNQLPHFHNLCNGKTGEHQEDLCQDGSSVYECHYALWPMMMGMSIIGYYRPDSGASTVWGGSKTTPVNTNDAILNAPKTYVIGGFNARQ